MSELKSYIEATRIVHPKRTDLGRQGHDVKI